MFWEKRGGECDPQVSAIADFRGVPAGTVISAAQSTFCSKKTELNFMSTLLELDESILQAIVNEVI